MGGPGVDDGDTGATADRPTELVVLRAKLHAPRRRSTTVTRARICEHLDRDRRALILVSAAAGFGKTTLLTDWLADRPGTAWLALDERDGDPARFWTYVLAALRTVAPQVGAGAEAALRGGSAEAEAAVTTLLNDLHAVDAQITLVLDDYHSVDSPELAETVGLFLANLPPHVTLVIATRADPGLPLANLRAHGDLTEIRAADLRFTTEEAAQYLNDAMGLALTDDDVAALEGRTEGWIAALQLAALSLDGRSDPTSFIEGFAGDDRFVLDYLAGEVLERQEAETRAFLLQTSILRRLEGSLCDAVTGRSDGRPTLEQLDRANLFLVPLDDRRSWYRYHHLFGDVLQARLLDEHPEQVAALHRRASRWYADEGDLDEAIHHALVAPDHPRAAELIEAAIPAMRQTRRESTMRSWFDALPPELFVDRPVLAIGYVGALMASGEFTGVDALLTDIHLALDPVRADRMVVVDGSGFDDLPAQLAIQRAGMALVTGDPTSAIAHADRALELAGPDHHLQRGSAGALVALGCWATGDLTTAEQRYPEAIRNLQAAGYVTDSLGCALALADIQAALGRLRAAQATLEGGLVVAASRDVLRGTADLHVGLAELALERHDLDTAAEHLQTSAQLGVHAALGQHPYRSRVALARLRLAQGDASEAFELLAKAAEVFDSDFSPPARPVPATAARGHLLVGDLDAASAWASSRSVSVDDDLTYLTEYEHLTLARLLLAQGEHGAATSLLDRLLDGAAAGGRSTSEIEALVSRSVAHDRAGDRTAAIADLTRGVTLAAAEGHLGAFIDAGSALRDLLDDVDLDGTPGRHLRRILDLVSPRAAGPSDRSGLFEDLSTRELDVLRLLRSDLSGPDIARELIVSLNTLRSHTKSIYAKLGVTSRREAVTRAGELDL